MTSVYQAMRNTIKVSKSCEFLTNSPFENLGALTASQPEAPEGFFRG